MTHEERQKRKDAVIADLRKLKVLNQRSILQVAASHNLSYFRTYQFGKSAGVIAGKKQSGSVRPEHITKVKDLYDNGLSSKEIAAKVGFSVTTVRSILKNHGATKVKSKVDDTLRIIALRQQNKTNSDIVSETGRSSLFVRKTLEKAKELGVTF